MRIAICFSGQLRTAVRCLPNLKNRFLVLGEGTECDLFAHTWTEDSRTLIVGEQPVSRERELVLRTVSVDEFAEVQRGLNFSDFQVESSGAFARQHRRNQCHPHVLAQTHSWRSSVVQMQNYSRITGREYDLAVKLRFDLIYQGGITVADIARTVEQWAQVDHSFLVNVIDSAGHPNDIIYVARPGVMDRVSQILDRRLKMGANDWDLEFKRAVKSQALRLHSLHEVLGLYQTVPHYYTILRNECPYEPDQFDHCDQFWKLYYQSFNLQSLDPDSWVFTEAELRRDAVMMYQRFGHVPPAVQHLIS